MLGVRDLTGSALRGATRGAGRAVVCARAVFMGARAGGAEVSDPPRRAMASYCSPPG